MTMSDTTETTSLQNTLLIAMPTMTDPSFSHTVIYVCEHSEEGSIGVIVNQGINVSMGEVFQQMNIECTDMSTTHKAVLLGGPVQQERGFVLHRPVGSWHTSIQTADDIGLTLSRDILEATAQGKGPIESIVTLGYTGWDAGQLENEIAQNAWLNAPAEPHILFELPLKERWAAAATLLGIDISQISHDIGHA